MAMNESNRLQNKKMINVEYQHIEEKPIEFEQLTLSKCTKSFKGL